MSSAPFPLLVASVPINDAARFHYHALGIRFEQMAPLRPAESRLP